MPVDGAMHPSDAITQTPRARASDPTSSYFDAPEPRLSELAAHACLGTAAMESPRRVSIGVAVEEPGAKAE